LGRKKVTKCKGRHFIWERPSRELLVVEGGQMTVRQSIAALMSVLVFSLAGKPIYAEPVRFATFDFAPYALRDDPQGRLGLFIDIDRAIASRANITIIDSVLPIARALKNMERGVSDCSVFVLTSWSKDNFIPVAKINDRLETVIVTRRGLTINSIEDLHGHRLAIPRGSFRDLPISTDPDIQKFYTNGYEQSVRLLKAGRVDAIAGSELSILHYLSIGEMGRKDIGEIFAFERKQLWLQCARDQLSSEMISKLQQATDSLRMEGVFDNLLKRYIPVGF